MGQWQIRRLPVLNHDKRLVGIVSLGDLSIGGAEEESKEALKEISEYAKFSTRLLRRRPARRSNLGRAYDLSLGFRSKRRPSALRDPRRKVRRHRAEAEITGFQSGLSATVTRSI